MPLGRRHPLSPQPPLMLICFLRHSSDVSRISHQSAPGVVGVPCVASITYCNGAEIRSRVERGNVSLFYCFLAAQRLSIDTAYVCLFTEQVTGTRVL